MCQGSDFLTDFLCSVEDSVLPREIVIQNHTKVLVISYDFRGSASTNDIGRGGHRAVESSWQDELTWLEFYSHSYEARVE